MSVQCKGQVRLFAEKFESWFSSLEWPQKSTNEDSDLKVSFTYHLLRLRRIYNAREHLEPISSNYNLTLRFDTFHF